MSGNPTYQEFTVLPSRIEVFLFVPQKAKEHQQLIEIVANFPKELMIASRYAGVSDLIGSV